MRKMTEKKAKNWWMIQMILNGCSLMKRKVIFLQEYRNKRMMGNMRSGENGLNNGCLIAK